MTDPNGESVPVTERERDLVAEARETAFAALDAAEGHSVWPMSERNSVTPLDVLLCALSDWVEVETTDHDTFGPRQDARAALIKAWDDWLVQG